MTTAVTSKCSILLWRQSASCLNARVPRTAVAVSFPRSVCACRAPCRRWARPSASPVSTPCPTPSAQLVSCHTALSLATPALPPVPLQITPSTGLCQMIILLACLHAPAWAVRASSDSRQWGYFLQSLTGKRDMHCATPSREHT